MALHRTAHNRSNTASPARSAWRPGAGLAVLQPGSSHVRTTGVKLNEVAAAPSVRSEVKASVRTLKLQPLSLDKPAAPAPVVPSREERVTMEFCKLEGNVGCARIISLNPSPLELERVSQQLQSLLGDVGGNLILDVTDVGSLHCAVINWLLNTRQACARLGGHMMLTGLSHQAHDMLVSTGLARKLHLADTAPEALGVLLDFQRRLAA